MIAWTKHLYIQVIIAIVLGVAFGCMMPHEAAAMKPLADAFIKLIKMLIAPIVFCTVVTGIAGMKNMATAGRIGLKAIIYFEVLTTLALLIGLAVAHLHQPGLNLHIDMRTLDAGSMKDYTAKAAATGSGVDFFLHLIPTTIVDAFAKGDMLQVLLISVLFALALMSLGGRGEAVHNFIHQLSAVLFTMMGWVVRLAPIGAFAAMAFAVGKYGVDILTSLAALMLDFYLTCIVFIAVGLGGVMRLAGLRLWPFLKYIKEEIVLVLGTSSSEAALPRMLDKMAKLGCAKPVVDMVIPTGYSFNLDGTCIYLTMAALFVAHATGTELTFADELTLLAVLLLTSKGAAAVTGGGFIVLAGTLSAIGHIPVEGLALILGVDRFMSEGRAITNLIGNGVATLVVSKWERALDMKKVKAGLGIRD